MEGRGRIMAGEMKNALYRVLERHGVSDANAYLDQFSDDARVGRSADPEVRLRGSIQLMKKRKIGRKDVDRKLASLKRF